MRRLRIIGTILATVLAGTAGATVGASPTSAQAGTGQLVGAVRDTQGAVVRDAMTGVYPSDPAGGDSARTTTDAAGGRVAGRVTTASGRRASGISVAVEDWTTAREWDT